MWLISEISNPHSLLCVLLIYCMCRLMKKIADGGAVSESEMSFVSLHIREVLLLDTKARKCV